MAYRLSQKMRLDLLTRDGYIFVLNEPKIKVLTRDISDENGPYKFFLACFFGASDSPSVYLSFNKIENRQAKIEVFIENSRKALARREEQKASAKAAKAAMENQLKPGDLLHASWGYEQTNCDFYQVIKITPKGAYLRRVAGTEVKGAGGWSGYLKPVKGQFISEEVTFHRLYSPTSVRVRYTIASKIENPDTEIFYYSTYA